MSLEKAHVKFNVTDSTCKSNSIVVEDIGDGCVQVHIGFLQYLHNYTVKFRVPKVSLLNYKKSDLLGGIERSIPSIYCRILSLEDIDDCYEFDVEFHAIKERLLREELKLPMNDGQTVHVIFKARVLGSGKGTPSLKDGVKCVGVNSDEMSEVSDWPGFK